MKDAQHRQLVLFHFQTKKIQSQLEHCSRNFSIMVKQLTTIKNQNQSADSYGSNLSVFVT